MAPVWLTMAPTLMGAPFFTVPAPVLSAATGAPAPPPTTLVVERPGVPAEPALATALGAPLGSASPPAPPLTYTVFVVVVLVKWVPCSSTMPKTTRASSCRANSPASRRSRLLSIGREEQSEELHEQPLAQAHRHGLEEGVDGGHPLRQALAGLDAGQRQQCAEHVVAEGVRVEVADRGEQLRVAGSDAAGGLHRCGQ